MSKELQNKLLEELVSLPFETEWVEFKKNNYNPEEISRLISSLSNTACVKGQKAGYLVFGVENETHQIVGTTFQPFTMKFGNEPIEHWLNQTIRPKLYIQIFELEQKGNKVVIFEIPSAKDRPTLSGQTGYIRIGSITRPLFDFPEHERLIWNNPLHRKFELESALSGLNSKETIEMLDINNFLRLNNLQKPSEDEAMMDILETENLVIFDQGAYCITNLGAILFANKLPNFDTIKRKSIRVIIYSGKDRTETVEEKIGQIGYASAFQRIVAFVNSKLPTNEVIQEALRVDRKVYPEIAVRELIANALIHQDFTVSGSGPMIEIFSDRLEIYNPGIPLVSTDRFIDTPPRSRNEILASSMRRMKICEERGSGIDKVIAAVEAYQLPAPRFETNENGMKVTLYAPRLFRQMDRLDRVRACYQHCCLNYVSNRETTNTTVRERFKISKNNHPMASKVIADTIDEKLIKPFREDSSKKLSKYVPFWA